MEKHDKNAHAPVQSCESILIALLGQVLFLIKAITAGNNDK